MLRSRRWLLVFAWLAGCGPGTAASELSSTGSSTEGTTSRATTDDDDESTSSDDESTSDDAGAEVCEIGCEGAVEVADGIMRCPDWRHNRVARGNFDPTITAPACVGDEDLFDCTSDAECTAGPHGRCIRGSTVLDPDPGDGDGDPGPLTGTICECAYACASDLDCDEGSVCIPTGFPKWPKCVPASCATNSDCGECGECGIGSAGWCDPSTLVACRVAGCTSSRECGRGACAPTLAGIWSCSYEECCDSP